MTRESSRRLIVIDPNIRPTVVTDQERYLRAFERWLRHAHIVKLSADDARWLYPEMAPEDVLAHLVAIGADLAVMTLGAEGAIARNAADTYRSRAHVVAVVDTVGAGDAFTAGLVYRLWASGNLVREAVAHANVSDALAFASAVGSLQSTRAGADPPTISDVQRFLKSTCATSSRTDSNAVPVLGLPGASESTRPQSESVYRQRPGSTCSR